MIQTDTICTCDVCGEKMRESESGHKHFPGYLILGSNINESDTEGFEDVCGECCQAIRVLIDRLQQKQREKNKEI